MTEKEIQNIVKITIENLKASNSTVLNQEELLIIKDNIAYIMTGLIGLKAGMQNNSNLVDLLELFDRKCQEVLELIDKKE